jgi:hypothetical protein
MMAASFALAFAGSQPHPTRPTGFSSKMAACRSSLSERYAGRPKIKDDRIGARHGVRRPKPRAQIAPSVESRLSDHHLA